MTIISQYQDKVIAIVGFETNVGKVVLKKILTLMGGKVLGIVLIDTKARNKEKIDVKVEHQLLEQDLYLKGCISPEVGEKIRFLFLDNEEEDRWNKN